eukprot:TRINITY_DN9377_c0_g1_i1.p1 TRINITY_DN9377_c0_g1~~TRINITY_DN9377_c0_g1_i1.p1  ORF type:complete len:584 (-),score=95.87 TRINITY_DN9377_c0_g1_i1:162-1913(-)
MLRSLVGSEMCIRDRTMVGCNNELPLSRITQRPLRRLTSPGPEEGQLDNQHGELVMFVGQELWPVAGGIGPYRVVDILGKGTFGQVPLCVGPDGKHVAVKVIRNRPAYTRQGASEVSILSWIRHQTGGGCECIVTMHDSFMCQAHLCIVFERLSISMLELLQQNAWRGVSTNLIRVFMCQLVEALVVLAECGVIHCDLKPENILLCPVESPSQNGAHIKLVDFGSACFAGSTVYTYIQSRFYRAPEVVLGLPYTRMIDVWSLGCIAMELLLGLPLYSASCEFDLLDRVCAMHGRIDPNMLQAARANKRSEFCLQDKGEWRLKTREEYRVDHADLKAGRQHFNQDSTLHDLVLGAPPTPKHSVGMTVDPNPNPLGPHQLSPQEIQVRCALENLVSGMVVVEPQDRWTPSQIAAHPFLTRAEFDGFFFPDPDPTHPYFHGTHHCHDTTGSHCHDTSAGQQSGWLPASNPIQIPGGPEVQWTLGTTLGHGSTHGYPTQYPWDSGPSSAASSFGTDPGWGWSIDHHHQQQQQQQQLGFGSTEQLGQWSTWNPYPEYAGDPHPHPHPHPHPGTPQSGHHRRNLSLIHI